VNSRTACSPTYADHLGRASLATTVTGTLVSQRRSLPYGETRWSSGPFPTDRRCTGQREEVTLGLYDYGARFYSPSLGRFISADSIVPEASNPQSFNRYSYVLGNPLKYVDSTGHWYYEPGMDALVHTRANYNEYPGYLYPITPPPGNVYAMGTAVSHVPPHLIGRGHSSVGQPTALAASSSADTARSLGPSVASRLPGSPPAAGPFMGPAGAGDPFSTYSEQQVAGLGILIQIGSTTTDLERVLLPSRDLTRAAAGKINLSSVPAHLSEAAGTGLSFGAGSLVQAIADRHLTLTPGQRIGRAVIAGGESVAVGAIAVPVAGAAGALCGPSGPGAIGCFVGGYLATAIPLGIAANAFNEKVAFPVLGLQPE